MSTVGLVGLGRMGQAIGLRLLEVGHSLVVSNRTPEKATPLLAAGARLVSSPRQVLAASDLVLTVLYDDLAVREVYLGLEGLLSGPHDAGPSDALLIDLSTIGRETAQAVREVAEQRGVRLVDAPMAGPPAAARAGQLLILAGGDPADVRETTPVLGSLARRVVHLGPHGAGVTMKLVLMHSMAVYFAGLAESLAVGQHLGLRPEEMLEVVLDSHGAPPALRDRAEALLSEIDGRPVPVGFPVAGVRKDLEAVVSTAAAAGVSSPVASSALDTFRAATAAGYGDRDLVSVVAYAMQRGRIGSEAGRIRAIV